MKRCNICNDRFVIDKLWSAEEGDIVECFVCGAKYKASIIWKTSFDSFGMFENRRSIKLTHIL